MEKQKNLIKELSKIISDFNSEAEVEKFLKEILTPKELSDITLRWQLLKELYQGKTQRDIASTHKISLCKITRGSKLLKTNNSISKKILNKYYGGNNE